MLNRTLSANLNGLNLGTRTLATANAASLNIVVDTLRLRHEHPQKRKDSMRGENWKLMGDLDYEFDFGFDSRFLLKFYVSQLTRPLAVPAFSRATERGQVRGRGVPKFIARIGLPILATNMGNMVASANPTARLGESIDRDDPY